MNLFPAKMFMMEKIKVAEGWIKSDNSDDLQQPFAIPFIVESLDGIQDIRDAKILCNCCICKHAFGTLHIYGKFAIKILMNHIKTGTLPIHMNLGRYHQTDLFVEIILPRLQSFFADKVLPLAGPRPNCYCRDTVRNIIIERDVANVMELNPGMFKRKIFTRYGYVNGYKIVYAADTTTIKSEHICLENKHEEWE